MTAARCTCLAVGRGARLGATTAGRLGAAEGGDAIVSAAGAAGEATTTDTLGASQSGSTATVGLPRSTVWRCRRETTRMIVWSSVRSGLLAAAAATLCGGGRLGSAHRVQVATMRQSQSHDSVAALSNVRATCPRNFRRSSACTA